MSSIKTKAKALYGSKLGKVLPVLLIAGLVATASASVFVLYYGSATATVRAYDVTLVAGPDASVSCTSYPCSTVTLSSTNDFATIGLSFAKSASNSPQPATYYTNLLQVHNAGSGSHTIQAVSISGIAQDGTDLGKISVYYCTTQTDTPATSANCAKFDITSTTGGSLTGNALLPATLAASGDGFVEVVAFASTSATADETVTFTVQIQWA